MASDALYQALAEALSQPSGGYKTFLEATGAANKIGEGYQQGLDIEEKLRKRKLQQQTLSEALGGQVPARLSPYSGLTAEQVSPFGPLLKMDVDKQKDSRSQQANFQLGGKLMEYDPDTGYTPARITGMDDKPGTPLDVTPRVPPTVPATETDFFGKADTLSGIFNDIRSSFRPEYVGPVAGPVGRAVDVYTPFGDEKRSHFRNQVAKAFNNLIYLRSGKQINEEEAGRLSEEFMRNNNSPVAFQSALNSMQDEMSSLVTNKRKSLVQSGYRGASGLGNPSPSFGGSREKTFNSEQEAEASGYKGPAIINGKRAILH